MGWSFEGQAIQKRGHHVITKKTNKANANSKGNATAPAIYGNTLYFSEPLFEISNAKTGERLAVLGASSNEEAIERCELLRREVPLPRASQLQSSWLSRGPVTGVPFFSNNFFAWHAEMADEFAQGTIVCPMCGR
jgi:hypothetical protein